MERGIIFIVVMIDMRMFLNNLSLRSSCYECKFTTTKRYGDITLGDFWGIGRKYPQWDDDKGISVVMLNTDKGMDVYNRIVDIFDSREETLKLQKQDSVPLMLYQEKS